MYGTMLGICAAFGLLGPCPYDTAAKCYRLETKATSMAVLAVTLVSIGGTAGVAAAARD